LLISLTAAYIVDNTRDHREHTLYDMDDLPQRYSFNTSSTRLNINFMPVDIDVSADW